MSNNECLSCRISWVNSEDMCEKCASCASQNYCADMQIPAFVNKVGCEHHIPKLDEAGEERV